MYRNTHKLLFNLLRLAFVMLLVINALTIFTAFSPETASAATNDTIVEASDLDEGVGGITQVTGIPTILISIGMLFSAFGLFTNKSWGLSTAIALLAVDMVFKTINLIAELIAGTAISDLWIGLIVLVFEGALYYAMRRYQREVAPVVQASRPATE